MGVQISSKLGVISCPGGEVFAKSVVEHLTRLFQRDLKRKTNDLVKKYGISPERVSIVKAEDLGYVNLTGCNAKIMFVEKSK